MFSILRTFAAITVLFAGHPAAADQPRYDKEDLYKDIRAQDHSAVEAAFGEVQRDYARGDANADYLRWLYEVFSTNNPDILRFSEGWLKAHPKSPYAHTALAWIYFRTGWYIRGEEVARDIYPEALSEFGSLHNRAWEHALAAYETDRMLLPASDAVMRLANSTGNKIRAYEILQEVMATHPEMGTLRRALGMTRPGWGGSWQMVEDLCDHYGPMITWDKSDPVLFCKTFAASEYYKYEKGGWAKRVLDNGTFPSLDSMRAWWATSHTATRADAAFAYAYLTRDGVTDPETARRFDEHVAQKYGYDFLYEAHIRRAKQHAETALEHDPYNPYLLGILAKNVVQYSIREGNLRSSMVERPAKADLIEYARRLIFAAPYNPKHWRTYARLRFRHGDPESFGKGEPYQINAIVYSNHSLERLNAYMFEKWNHLASLQRLDTDPQRPEWQALNEEQRAKAEAFRQSWLARRDHIDLDGELRCPMMRAYRVFELICETKNSYVCDLGPDTREMYEIVKSDVNERQVCKSEMLSPAYDLFYVPVEVDLKAPEG